MAAGGEDNSMNKELSVFVLLPNFGGQRNLSVNLLLRLFWRAQLRNSARSTPSVHTSVAAKEHDWGNNFKKLFRDASNRP